MLTVSAVTSRVGERQIGQHSDPRLRGKPWQPRYEPGDGSADPRKEFSFLVNGYAGPWKRIVRAEMVPAPRTAACHHAVGGDSRCPRKIQGSNPLELVRTKNRSRSPGPRASGQWNNVAKGSRQNGGVTWEEALALRAGQGAADPSNPCLVVASAGSRRLELPPRRGAEYRLSPGCKQPP